MKIFNGEKWVNVAGDAGFEDDILLVGGHTDRKIVVKDDTGEILGVFGKDGIELIKAKFNFLEADNVVPILSSTTFYVDAKNGDDNNNGLSSSQAFKTIGAAMDLVKNKKLAKASKIEIASGTYNENIYIEGNSGAGILTLTFAANVIINGFISVTGCSNMISLVGTKTTINQTEDTVNYVIGANFTKHLRITGFNINARAKTQHGVLAYRGSTISLKESSVNNVINTTAAAITAYENSMIYVDNCTGSNNYRSVWSASGSIITISNKIPHGTNTGASATGQIFGTAKPTVFEGTIPTPPKSSKTVLFNSNSARFWKTTVAKWQNGIFIGDYSLSTGGSGKGGNNFGVFTMDMDTIRSQLQGKTITSVKITIKRKTSGGYDTTVAPYLGLTTSTGSGSAPTIFKEIGSLGNFTKGQSKEVSIPVSIVNDILKNTSVKSFILYRPDKKHYSIFEGTLQLNITYTE